MEDRNENIIMDKIFLEVPNVDKNQCFVFDTDDINILCQYDDKYSYTELRANKSGLIALAKICLQLAFSTHEMIHVDLDEYNYFGEKSSGLSIIKTDNVSVP